MEEGEEEKPQNYIPRYGHFGAFLVEVFVLKSSIEKLSVDIRDLCRFTETKRADSQYRLASATVEQLKVPFS